MYDCIIGESPVLPANVSLATVLEGCSSEATGDVLDMLPTSGQLSAAALAPAGPNPTPITQKPKPCTLNPGCWPALLACGVSVCLLAHLMAGFWLQLCAVRRLAHCQGARGDVLLILPCVWRWGAEHLCGSLGGDV